MKTSTTQKYTVHQAKRKRTVELSNEIIDAKDSVRQLKYDDYSNFDEDMKLNAQLSVLNINSKANIANHPSITKYTNNPYKATSTLSFYNNLNDVKIMGKLAESCNS